MNMGGRFNQSWGMDVDLGLVYNAMKPVPNPFTGESEGLDMFQIPMILSLTYRLPFHGPLDVYGGFGVGPVLGIYSGGGTSIIGINNDWSFGYQATLGFKYALSDKCDFGIAYKFLGTTDHDMGRFKTDGTLNHSLLATLTWKF
jgi:hypothetical protein